MKKIDTKLEALAFINELISCATADVKNKFAQEIESVDMDCDNKSGDLDLVLKNGQIITLSSSDLSITGEEE